MNKALPFLRFLFVIVMLCCVGILIWLVPSSQSVTNAASQARDDIEFYSKLIEKQSVVDHNRYLNSIQELQDYLDANMTPEYDEYWRTTQIRTVARDARQALRNEITTLQSDITFYEESLDMMLHPEKYEYTEEDEEDEGDEEDDTNW